MPFINLRANWSNMFTRYRVQIQSLNSPRGNTYPTTALPFGMNTWTSQTGVNGDGLKYQYFIDEIRGFQQAHQCSPSLTIMP